MNIGLNGQEIKFILEQIKITCESYSLKENIFTFNIEDYDGIGETELKIMERLKQKLERK